MGEFNILRDYQSQLVQQVLSSWKQGNRQVLLQLPTGGGKTLIFSEIARLFLEKGEGVLVLAHRIELITQAHSKLVAVSGKKAGFIKSGMSSNWDYPIQVASVQTLTRKEEYPRAGLVIVDEAHHSITRSYTRILEAYPDAKVLGVSATPMRTDGQGLKQLYDDLIVGPSVNWLIEKEYLSPFKLYASHSSINTKGIKITAGDYNQRQLAKAIDTSLNNSDVLKSWLEYAQNKQTVIFNVSVKHSQQLVQDFRDQGIKAEHIDGETPAKERESIIARFRDKEITVLSNCGIVTEGFDVPGIECIQCVRPTKSLILWLQMVGRGLRKSPQKKQTILIDHSQNWFEHGLPDAPREWSLEAISLDEPNYSLKCPHCTHVFRPLPHELSNPVAAQINQRFNYLELHKCVCPGCSQTLNFRQTSDNTLVLDDKTKTSLKLIKITPGSQGWARQLIATNYKKANQKGLTSGWVYSQIKKHERLAEFSKADWIFFAAILDYQASWAESKWREISFRVNQKTDSSKITQRQSNSKKKSQQKIKSVNSQSQPIKVNYKYVPPVKSVNSEESSDKQLPVASDQLPTQSSVISTRRRRALGDQSSVDNEQFSVENEPSLRETERFLGEDNQLLREIEPVQLNLFDLEEFRNIESGENQSAVEKDLSSSPPEKFQFVLRGELLTENDAEVFRLENGAKIKVKRNFSISLGALAANHSGQRQRASLGE